MSAIRLHIPFVPLVAFVAALAVGGVASAQGDTAPAPPSAAPAAPQAPGGPVVEQDTAGLYFEWGLTVVGAGLAVFAVCRSSRRN